MDPLDQREALETPVSQDKMEPREGKEVLETRGHQEKLVCQGWMG